IDPPIQPCHRPGHPPPACSSHPHQTLIEKNQLKTLQSGENFSEQHWDSVKSASRGPRRGWRKVSAGAGV
ncbi:hypothetical protein GWI33_010464, partial [Rhynchophorus ferrugineus]